ncbi:MAG: hypothetical protein QNJ64_02835 [Crocosphaera sp.]|nr:hypothetical protein [Crocosphaera sp.]
MTHPKPSHSSLRYFLAGLKPLANIKVWGSLGLMGLVAICLWQYSIHPEWLGADGLPSQSVDGEFEAEVGNNIDIGVTLENDNLNPSGIPENSAFPQGTPFDDPLETAQPETPILSDPLLDPPSVPQEFANPNRRGKSPSLGFQPLIPSFKDLGSLFPPLQPSKNASRPIKIPDTVVETPQSQENPLKDALDNLDTSPTSLRDPSTPQNSQPLGVPVRPVRPNYPAPITPRGNAYPNSTYPQPNNPSVSNDFGQTAQPPYVNSQPYNPQPYSNPYGNGVAPAPIPAYPSSQPSFGERNPNANNQGEGNQRPQQNNYGIEPPQVDSNEGFGY